MFLLVLLWTYHHYEHIHVFQIYCRYYPYWYIHTFPHIWLVGAYSRGFLNPLNTTFVVLDNFMTLSMTSCSRIIFDISCPRFESVIYPRSLEVFTDHDLSAMGAYRFWLAYYFYVFSVDKDGKFFLKIKYIMNSYWCF